MVWVEEFDTTNVSEKEVVTGTANANFVGDGKIPDTSDPNLITSTSAFGIIKNHFKPLSNSIPSSANCIDLKTIATAAAQTSL